MTGRSLKPNIWTARGVLPAITSHAARLRGTLSVIGLTGSGYEADDRQDAVGLLLVLCEAGRGGGDLLPRLVALCPVQLFRAVTAIVRPSISTVTSSGCAAML